MAPPRALPMGRPQLLLLAGSLAVLVVVLAQVRPALSLCRDALQRSTRGVTAAPARPPAELEARRTARSAAGRRQLRRRLCPGRGHADGGALGRCVFNLICAAASSSAHTRASSSRATAARRACPVSLLTPYVPPPSACSLPPGLKPHFEGEYGAHALRNLSRWSTSLFERTFKLYKQQAAAKCPHASSCELVRCGVRCPALHPCCAPSGAPTSASS